VVEVSRGKGALSAPWLRQKNPNSISRVGHLELAKVLGCVDVDVVINLVAGVTTRGNLGPFRRPSGISINHQQSLRNSSGVAAPPERQFLLRD
jgi:hypothetical protein